MQRRQPRRALLIDVHFVVLVQNPPQLRHVVLRNSREHEDFWREGNAPWSHRTGIAALRSDDRPGGLAACVELCHSVAVGKRQSSPQVCFRSSASGEELASLVVSVRRTFPHGSQAAKPTTDPGDFLSTGRRDSRTGLVRAQLGSTAHRVNTGSVNEASLIHPWSRVPVFTLVVSRVFSDDYSHSLATLESSTLYLIEYDTSILVCDYRTRETTKGQPA